MAAKKTEEEQYLEIITELANKLDFMQQALIKLDSSREWQQGVVIDEYIPEEATYANVDQYLILKYDDDVRVVGKQGPIVDINIKNGTVDIEIELTEQLPEEEEEPTLPGAPKKKSVKMGTMGFMGGYAPIAKPPKLKRTKVVARGLKYHPGQWDEIDVIPLDPNASRKYFVLSGRGANWHYVHPATNTGYITKNLKIGSKIFLNEKGFITHFDQGVPNYTVNTVRVTVQNIHQDKFIEIEGNRMVRFSPELKHQIVAENRDLEVGDDIIVDASGIIALARLDKSAYKGKKTTTTNARVEWSAVVGLEDAKQRIIDNIINPMQYKELYKNYGMNAIPKGMMLYGPPGCGKTMLGRAIATAIADASGHDMTDTGFIYIKSTELLNSYVGESERAVRSLFQKARRHTEKSGWPAIIFIDEADAILANRDGNTLNKSLVAPFLTEMDGFDHSSAFVILATNRHDMLDPAVTRNGRIDFKIRVNRPTKEILQGIIHNGLSKTRCFDDPVNLSQIAADEFWDERKFIKSIKTYKHGEINIKLSDCANGAMAQSIVNESITSSIKRDISRGGIPTGVTRDDVIESVRSIYHQSQNLSHDDVLYELVERIEND